MGSRGLRYSVTWRRVDVYPAIMPGRRARRKVCCENAADAVGRAVGEVEAPRPVRHPCEVERDVCPYGSNLTFKLG